MSAVPDEAQWQQIDEALRTNRLIEAIRLYRVATRSELAMATSTIRQRQASLHDVDSAVSPMSEPLPEMVRHYLDGGHGRPGELVAQWRNRKGDHCVLVLYQRVPVPMFELGVFPPVGHWGHDLNGAIYSLAEVGQVVSGERAFYGADFGDDTQALATIRSWLATLTATPVKRQVIESVLRLRSSRTALYSLDGARFEHDFLFLPQQVPLDWWRETQALAATDGDLHECIEELPAGAITEYPTSVSLGAGTGMVVWARSAIQCAATMTAIDELDTLFADLAAQPIDDQRFTPQTRTAYGLMRGAIDVAGLRRAQRPWWLDALAAQTTASIGLLAPHELRHIARHRDDMSAVLNTSEIPQAMRADLDTVLTAITQAAAADRWLIGIEPGT